MTSTTPVKADVPGADSTERHLQIVAHEDDDLIFLNPEIMQAIQRGAPTRTVYVTAGEWDGQPSNREDYAESRREGTCAAYAEMADVANEWTRTATTINDRSIELDVLTAQPSVEVMFLALPDGGDDEQPQAVPNLWASATATASTLVYPDSPAEESLTYTRDDLLATLAAIIQEFAPTVIRVQDTNPDPYLRRDHEDHIAVACFARAAADAAGGTAILLEHRCYNTENSEQNLTDPLADDKTTILHTYVDFDALFVGPEADRYYIEARRCYQRWGLGPAWAGPDGQGRLHAFAVQGGQVLTWHQDSNGAWTGPSTLGDDPPTLAPTLAVGVNADGRVQVFGVDLDSSEVMTASQLSVDGEFSGWESLGNPTGPEAHNTGQPAVGSNADGRLQVFVKNSGGGISTKWQLSPNGTFSEWADLGGGPDIQGVPACLTRPDGRMELFATTRTQILGWSQTAPNDTWDTVTELTTDTPTSSPTVARNADGRSQVFWRGAHGEAHTIYTLLTGDWSGLTNLGGPGGTGELAAVSADTTEGRIVLLGRDPAGGLTATWQTAPNDAFGPWVDLDGTTPATPAVVRDNTARPLALHLGNDASLHVTSIDTRERAESGHKTGRALPGDPHEGGVLDQLSLGSGATLPYYRNYSLSETAVVTRAVVVVHGVDRNAQDYFDSIAHAAADLGVAEHTIIIAPHFQIEDDDPGEDDAYWTNSGRNSWKDGGNAVKPAELSSFEVMDEILTTLANKDRFPELTRITLVGHSAGGMFTQCYAAGGRAPNTLTNMTIKYVTANPSSYLYLNSCRPVQDDLPESCPRFNEYRYGLENRNEYMTALSDEQIRQQYTTRHVTYLLGSADIYQNHKIDKSCMAKAQGDNRFERGQFYYSTIHTLYPTAPHILVVVPDVGHDHDAMFNSTQGKTAIFHDSTTADTPGKPRAQTVRLIHA